MDTVGPSFSASRVLRFGELPSDEQEAFTRFFCEQKVNVRQSAVGAGALAAARGGSGPAASPPSPGRCLCLRRRP